MACTAWGKLVYASEPVGQTERIRCPCCGMFSAPARFGIDDDSTFDADRLPQHDLTLLLNTFSGRGRITSDRQPLPLSVARALRESMVEALARLDAEIKSVEP